MKHREMPGSSNCMHRPPGPSIHPSIRHPPLLQSHRKNGKLLCETDLRPRPSSAAVRHFAPVSPNLRRSKTGINSGRHSLSLALSLLLLLPPQNPAAAAAAAAGTAPPRWDTHTCEQTRYVCMCDAEIVCWATALRPLPSFGGAALTDENAPPIFWKGEKKTTQTGSGRRRE